MKKTSYLVFSIFVFISQLCNAQTSGKISGKIIDEEDLSTGGQMSKRPINPLILNPNMTRTMMMLPPALRPVPPPDDASAKEFATVRCG